MRIRWLPFCLMPGFVFAAVAAADDQTTAADATSGFMWQSAVPKDCPFARSPTLTGISFTGRHSDYHCGDTLYPSWASDGNLYSPWIDGTTDGVKCTSGGSLANGFRTGHAVLIGDDPLKLVIRNTSPLKQALAAPYRGRYPRGSLIHDGIWYFGTYCLGAAANFTHEGFTWNWPNLGPMPGLATRTKHPRDLINQSAHPHSTPDGRREDPRPQRYSEFAVAFT